MRFFDERRLNQKIASVCQPRNLRLGNQNTATINLFGPVTMYLGAFYQGIADDTEGTDILHVLANTSENRFEAFNMLLAFYWFWSLDRLLHRISLQDSGVQKGLEEIWDVSIATQTNYASVFDQYAAASPYILHKYASAAVAGELDAVAFFGHLRNAQIGTLKIIDNVLQH